MLKVVLFVVVVLLKLTSGGLLTAPSNDDFLEVVQKFGDFVNPNVNPCDNFAQYVCAKPGASFGRLIGDSRDFSTVLQDIYDKGDGNLSDVEVLIKEFHETCEKPHSVGEFMETSIFKDLNGSSILQFNENSTQFDWGSAVILLKHAGFSFFIHDEIDEENNSIKISPMLERETSLLHVDEWTNKLKTTFMDLGTNESVVDHAIHLLVTFKDTLSNYQNEIDLNSSATEEISFLELKEKFPSFDWEEYFFDNKISDTANITLVHSEVFFKLLKYLNETNPDIVGSYILSEIAYGVDKPCDVLLEVFFQNIYPFLEYEPYFDEQQLVDIFNRVDDAYTTILSTSPFVDNTIKEITKKRITTWKNSLENYRTNILLKYKNFKVDPSNFYETYLRLRKNIVEKPPKEPEPEEKLTPTKLFNILNKGLFNSHYPPAVNYGAWGTFIAYMMIQGYESSLSWRASDSDQFYKKVSQCISQREHIPYNFNSTNTSDNVMDWIIVNHGCLKVGLEAYDNYLKDVQNDSKKNEASLKEFNLSNKKMFFVASIGFYCFGNDAIGEDSINAIYFNLQEFADTFECSERTVINSRTRCPLW